MVKLKKKYVLKTSRPKDKIRDHFLNDYKKVVFAIARKISSRLPSSVEIDDLVSVGYLGLMDALDKYDPTMNNKFRTYAEFRIRGAIIDELRSQDTIPRSVRDKVKEIDSKVRELEARHGRSVEMAEVAESLGISLDEINSTLLKGEVTKYRHLDMPLRRSHDEAETYLDTLVDLKSIDPVQKIEDVYRKKVLKDAISRLQEKQRMVLTLYYFESLKFREIGSIIGVSESRVCQLHLEGLKNIRPLLERKLS